MLVVESIGNWNTQRNDRSSLYNYQLSHTKVGQEPWQLVFTIAKNYPLSIKISLLLLYLT